MYSQSQMYHSDYIRLLLLISWLLNIIVLPLDAKPSKLIMKAKVEKGKQVSDFKAILTINIWYMTKYLVYGKKERFNKSP